MAASVAAKAAEQSASGLPQFDLAQWPGEIAWALVIFAALYALFTWVFVPAVAGTIDQREDKISGDIGEARRLRDQAEAESAAAAAELDQARGRAHRLAAEAKAAAKAEADKRQAEEDAVLATRLAEAEGRIAAARGEAMGHVRAIAAEAAEAMVARLTGHAPSRDELDRAVAAQA